MNRTGHTLGEAPNNPTVNQSSQSNQHHDKNHTKPIQPSNHITTKTNPTPGLDQNHSHLHLKVRVTHHG